MYLGATVVYTAPSVLRMTGPSPVSSGGQPPAGVSPGVRPVPVNVMPIPYRPATPTLAPAPTGALTPASSLAPVPAPSDSGSAPAAPPQVVYAGAGSGAGSDTGASAPAAAPTDYTPLLIAGGLLALLAMVTR